MSRETFEASSELADNMKPSPPAYDPTDHAESEAVRAANFYTKALSLMPDTTSAFTSNTPATAPYPKEIQEALNRLLLAAREWAGCGSLSSGKRNERWPGLMPD